MMQYITIMMQYLNQTGYSNGGWYLPGFEEHFYLTTQNDFTMPTSLSSPSPSSSSSSVRALGVMSHQRSGGNPASKTDTGSSFDLVGCKQFRRRF